MSKRATLLAVPALVAATAAIAQQPVTKFTHDGVTYSYVTTTDADGNTVLTGRSVTHREPFRLVIRKGIVTGHTGGRPVRFSVASAKGALGTPIATRIASAD